MPGLAGLADVRPPDQPTLFSDLLSCASLNLSWRGTLAARPRTVTGRVDPVS
jgi:hypothetical protein